ncbi:MAG: hypothetical protein HY696_05060 [Deltaproteobacteria bacterium]|nr:hypothetical protein [Deltaproteobacteria bacterium]
MFDFISFLNSYPLWVRGLVGAVVVQIAVIVIACIYLPRTESRPAHDPIIVAIQSAIESLTARPNQFQLTVMNAGIVGTGGGTGVSADAHGGAANSVTIGAIGIADGNGIEIMEVAANERLTQEAGQAVKLLEQIRDALTSASVQKPQVETLLSRFAQSSVAPVLKDIIIALVKNTLAL